MADVTRRTATLKVPGATLHYQVRGAGPLVLMLQGGDGEAEASDALADHLVERFTVVSYDRRGLVRSPLDHPEEAARLEVRDHGEDVHHLLAALTSEPALVFGSSIGGVIGLDLVSRHPEQVRLLVAHEAPVAQLLPEAEQAEIARGQEEVEALHRRAGVLPALRQFLVLTQVNLQDREPGLPLPLPSSRRAANLAFFLTRDAPAVRRFRLELEALEAARARVLPAVGRSKPDTWTARCGRALAERLGRPVLELPGDHGGYAAHPRGFAEVLGRVFTETLGAQASGSGPSGTGK